MGFIDEIWQVIRSATSNNIKELRIRQLAGKNDGRWVVDVTAPWETASQICERLHISPSKFRRRWKRRPQGSGRAEVGPTGRLIHVQSDEKLDTFLQGTSHLGAITPEQIVHVTIEVASPQVRALKLASEKRHKSLVTLKKTS